MTKEEYAKQKYSEFVYDIRKRTTCSTCEYRYEEFIDGIPYMSCEHEENGTLAVDAIHGVGCNRWELKEN